jgi:diazepam-binding inhibitor (GABA receptor modulator, acyl-CoA-binding protein)
MSLEEKFTDAQQRVNNLSKRPDNMELLELYALFKQGSAGDVTGKRPGRLDFKGRAKYDVWAGKKGLSKSDAMESYVATVDRLFARYG